jgi:O-antigen/teichoic acid export membrane protein
LLQLIKKIIREKHFLSLAANFFSAVLGFSSFLILVRSMDQNSFGEWVLFITAATMIDMLRLGITRVALARYLSGITGEERKQFIGSSWTIGMVSILIIALILYPLLILFPQAIRDSGFHYFFVWYPVLALSNFPWGNALSIQQADEKFDVMLFLRIFSIGSFVIYLLINYFFFKSAVIWVIIWFIITNLITSLISTLFNWDGSRYMFKGSRKVNLITLKFGKYSMGTSIGSSLLKSADAFIIGLSPFLGTIGVAIYSIPIKYTEIIEIILRSFTTTAFPMMSKASIEKDHDKFRKIFFAYSGGLTLLLIPLSLGSAFVARTFVILMGGNQYIQYADGLAIIMYMFIIFSMLLPIDRFTGIGLDSINKPGLNFLKTMIMTTVNIIGDIIAVFLLPVIFPTISMMTVLIFVSVGSILFQMIGLMTGFYLLNKQIGRLSFSAIFIEGIAFYKEIYTTVIRHRK